MVRSGESQGQDRPPQALFSSGYNQEYGVPLHPFDRGFASVVPDDPLHFLPLVGSANDFEGLSGTHKTQTQTYVQEPRSAVPPVVSPLGTVRVAKLRLLPRWMSTRPLFSLHNALSCQFPATEGPFLPSCLYASRIHPTQSLGRNLFHTTISLFLQHGRIFAGIPLKPLEKYSPKTDNNQRFQGFTLYETMIIMGQGANNLRYEEDRNEIIRAYPT